MAVGCPVLLGRLGEKIERAEWCHQFQHPHDLKPTQLSRARPHADDCPSAGPNNFRKPTVFIVNLPGLPL